MVDFPRKTVDTMTQSVLMVLATCLGLCAANSMMINDGILISALVFAILGCLLACVLMSYAFYMQRKRKGKGAEGLNQSLVGGGYGDNGGHDHHLHSGSRGYEWQCLRERRPVRVCHAPPRQVAAVNKGSETEVLYEWEP